MTHRIHIEPTTIRGERGQRYRVLYQGAVLLAESWNPEPDACRALFARGIIGGLQVWRSGKAHPEMLVRDIAETAELSIEENEKSDPALCGGGRDPSTSHRMPFPDRPRLRQRPFWGRALPPYPGKKPSLPNDKARDRASDF
jgi:hypothetical protein